jgi:hypothetical protein
MLMGGRMEARKVIIGTMRQNWREYGVQRGGRAKYGYPPASKIGTVS